MQAEVTPVIWAILSKVAIGAAVTGVGALLMYPFKKAKKEWASLKQSMEDTKQELVLQRTNHLHHIEINGAEQTKLLEKAVETLEAIHLGQVEMSGYIKAGFYKE